jgi:hypothetical protein
MDGDNATADGRQVTGREPGESAKERVDRELGELLQETRVALPGVEILFGFLILLPFSQGFQEISGLERLLYLASLVCTSAALALLVATTSYHRLLFREMDKERLLFRANRFVIGASVLMALALALAVFLAVEAVIGGVVAALIAASNAFWFAWFWFGLPLWQKARGRP